MDILGLLILLGFGWLVGVLLLAIHTAYMLTHPPRRTYSYALAKQLPSNPSELRVSTGNDAVESSLTYSEWTFRSGDIDHPVWDIAGCGPAGPTVIITHGWGDSRVVMLQRVGALAKYASRIVVWDIPAHGDSPDSRIFSLGAREHLHLRALIDAIAGSVDNNASVVLYGFSLGAGISIVCAATGKASDAEGAAPTVRAVIAEAPYGVPITPARNVLRQAKLPHALNLPLAMLWLSARFGFGASWLRNSHAGGFDRREHAANLRVPLLILHGTNDAVCPLADARDIAAAAPNATLVEVPGAGHLDLWTDDKHAATCGAEVAKFLAAI